VKNRGRSCTSCIRCCSVICVSTIFYCIFGSIARQARCFRQIKLCCLSFPFFRVTASNARHDRYLKTCSGLSRRIIILIVGYIIVFFGYCFVPNQFIATICCNVVISDVGDKMIFLANHCSHPWIKLHCAYRTTLHSNLSDYPRYRMFPIVSRYMNHMISAIYHFCSANAWHFTKVPATKVGFLDILVLRNIFPLLFHTVYEFIPLKNRVLWNID